MDQSANTQIIIVVGLCTMQPPVSGQRQHPDEAYASNHLASSVEGVPAAAKVSETHSTAAGCQSRYCSDTVLCAVSIHSPFAYTTKTTKRKSRHHYRAVPSINSGLTTDN